MSVETEMLKQRRKDLEGRLNDANVERQNALQYAQQMSNEIVGLARAISEFDDIIKIIDQLPRAPKIDQVGAPAEESAAKVEAERRYGAHADQAADQ